MSSQSLEEKILALVRSRLGDRTDQYHFPPPVFVALGGEFFAFDPDLSSLTVRFPILAEHLNPFGALQGGMIAAAVDNTLGPLSVLVAPPSLTRRLELTYSHPVTPDLGAILVTGKFIRQDGQRLYFTAQVRDPDGRRLARAKAVHFIPD